MLRTLISSSQENFKKGQKMSGSHRHREFTDFLLWNEEDIKNTELKESQIQEKIIQKNLE